MCHCIFLGINPHVTLHHAFHLYSATWWQHGLTSKENTCATLCQLLVEAGRAGLSQTPSTAITVTSSTCRNKCAHQRRSIMAQKSTAVDGGKSDTRSIQVVSFQLRVSITLCQWLLEL